MDFKVIKRRDDEGVQITQDGDTIRFEWDDRHPADQAEQVVDDVRAQIEAQHGRRVLRTEASGRTLTLHL